MGKSTHLYTIEEYKNLKEKIEDIDKVYEEKEKNISLLIKEKVKFNKKDVIFAFKKDSQVYRLEKGNRKAGLFHILFGNITIETDKNIDITKFDNDDKINYDLGYIYHFKVDKKVIPFVIKDFIINGKLVYSKERCIDGNKGFDRIYKIKNKYLLTGIGDNGFIVNAFPISYKRYKQYKEEEL